MLYNLYKLVFAAKQITPKLSGFKAIYFVHDSMDWQFRLNSAGGHLLVLERLMHLSSTASQLQGTNVRNQLTVSWNNYGKWVVCFSSSIKLAQTYSHGNLRVPRHKSRSIMV